MHISIWLVKEMFIIIIIKTHKSIKTKGNNQKKKRGEKQTTVKKNTAQKLKIWYCKLYQIADMNAGAWEGPLLGSFHCATGSHWKKIGANKLFLNGKQEVHTYLVAIIVLHRKRKDKVGFLHVKNG